MVFLSSYDWLNQHNVLFEFLSISSNPDADLQERIAGRLELKILLKIVIGNPEELIVNRMLLTVQSDKRRRDRITARYVVSVDD